MDSDFTFFVWDFFVMSQWKNPVSPQVYWDRSGNQVRSLWAGYVDLVLVAVCSSRKIMSLETSQIQYLIIYGYWE